MFCSNPSGLLDRLVQERNLSLDTTDVHVGIDGGQGWLKMGLVITDRSKEIHSGRAHYSEV